MLPTPNDHFEWTPHSMNSLFWVSQKWCYLKARHFQSILAPIVPILRSDFCNPEHCIQSLEQNNLFVLVAQWEGEEEVPYPRIRKYECGHMCYARTGYEHAHQANGAVSMRVRLSAMAAPLRSLWCHLLQAHDDPHQSEDCAAACSNAAPGATLRPPPLREARIMACSDAAPGTRLALRPPTMPPPAWCLGCHSAWGLRCGLQWCRSCVRVTP